MTGKVLEQMNDEDKPQPVDVHGALAPSLRLAHDPGAQGDNVLQGQRGVARLPASSRPALLISFVYLPQFEKSRHLYAYRDWALDSGAYSAYNSGKPVDLKLYIETCQRLLHDDPSLTEVFALDVIGDWKASIVNTEKMWEAGVPAIPAFHADEPWEALEHIAANYSKIALGGVALANTKKKMPWAGQCFSRVWPKRIHGFGFGSEAALMGLPWHSVDATSWEIGACKYGQWRSFNNAKLRIRGSKQNLRSEVEFYLRLERRARARWAKEMAVLASLDDAPILRLALRTPDGQPNDRQLSGLGKDIDGS